MPRRLFLLIAIAGAAYLGAGGAFAGSSPSGWSVTHAFAPIFPPLESVTCATWSHCLGMANGGGLLSTKDGGRTWAPASGPTPEFSEHGIRCVSGRTCFIVGNDNHSHGVIATSRDAGATWRSHTIDSVQSLNAIRCPTSNRCYAVGDARFFTPVKLSKPKTTSNRLHAPPKFRRTSFRARMVGGRGTRIASWASRRFQVSPWLAWRVRPR